MTRALVLAVVLAASPAEAGRTLYGWLPETATTPDGTMELATSLYEHTDIGPLHERSTSFVWTPAVALTPCLELAVPVALVTRTQDDQQPWSGIREYGAELRWRMPPHASPLHTLARFGVARSVELQTELQTEAELAASYDLGGIDVEAAVAGVFDINFSHLHEELRPGVGATILVVDELRLGGELHAELSRDATRPSWAAAGPTVAWQRGRFWLAGTLAFGVVHARAAPRLNIGMVW